MTTIHIHARDIVFHDAVGSFCRQLAQLFSTHGYDVHLWAENTNVETPPHPVKKREFFKDALSPEDIIFFNYSICDPLLEEIIALPNRKIAYYHNITPPELIDPADADTVRNCASGIEQRGRLAGFDALLANSSFTAGALLAGMDEADAQRWHGRVTVCPPLIGADRWKGVTSSPTPARAAALNALFVGRLVPHKGVGKILNVADCLCASASSLSLVIVGGPSEGAYVEALKAQAAAILERRPSLQISFLHGISDEDLKMLYEETDFAIIHSQHEGFCIPALDALAFDKPVFAVPQPAVLDVLGQAMLLIDAADPAIAAAQISSFMKDGQKRASHGLLRHQRFGELRRMADGDPVLNVVREVEAR